MEQVAGTSAPQAYFRKQALIFHAASARAPACSQASDFRAARRSHAPSEAFSCIIQHKRPIALVANFLRVHVGPNKKALVKGSFRSFRDMVSESPSRHPAESKGHKIHELALAVWFSGLRVPKACALRSICPSSTKLRGAVLDAFMLFLAALLFF